VIDPRLPVRFSETWGIDHCFAGLAFPPGFPVMFAGPVVDIRTVAIGAGRDLFTHAVFAPDPSPEAAPRDRLLRILPRGVASYMRAVCRVYRNCDTSTPAFRYDAPIVVGNAMSRIQGKQESLQTWLERPRARIDRYISPKW